MSNDGSSFEIIAAILTLAKVTAKSDSHIHSSQVEAVYEALLKKISSERSTDFS